MLLEGHSRPLEGPPVAQEVKEVRQGAHLSSGTPAGVTGGHGQGWLVLGGAPEARACSLENGT